MNIELLVIVILICNAILWVYEIRHTDKLVAERLTQLEYRLEHNSEALREIDKYILEREWT